MLKVSENKKEKKRKKLNTCFFVNLDSSSVALQTDNLTHKTGLADTNQLVHCSAAHFLGNDDCVQSEQTSTNQTTVARKDIPGPETE